MIVYPVATRVQASPKELVGAWKKAVGHDESAAGPFRLQSLTGDLPGEPRGAKTRDLAVGSVRRGHPAASREQYISSLVMIKGFVY